MTTYLDLKSVKFIDQALSYAEALLGCAFKKVGKDKYAAFCPFHEDKRDSFRVRVDKKGEVRFHCFGECKGDWDIFDLIVKKKGGHFHSAQEEFARYLGIKDFIPYKSGKAGKGKTEVQEQVDEPYEPVSIAEPQELHPKVITALADAANLYNRILVDNPDKFEKVHAYLSKRGIDAEMVNRFNIGFAPALQDEEYAGRALMREHYARFMEDPREFYYYSKGGLVRLLEDASAEGHHYYRRYVGSEKEWSAFAVYADYLAGRITFPINDIQGKPAGFVGRKLDEREPRWTKLCTDDTFIQTRGWLYGIDKAARWIKHYGTVILVEGIFDYFAFYNLLQDTSKPIVVATLGTNLTDETRAILNKLGVKNYVVAFDWDTAGKKAILKATDALGCVVHYLGGMADDQDPADKLKQVSTFISGFSMKHLLASARKAQKGTGKPVFISHISSGKRSQREVVLKPDATLEISAAPARAPKEFHFAVDDFLPLLSYDHGNKAALDAKLQQVIKMLNARPKKTGSEQSFSIPAGFLSKEIYDDLGPALILWLRLVIEQQQRKKRVRETDETIAQWLKTTRKTIARYKQDLHQLGFITIDTGSKLQRLSVKFFPK